VVPVSVLARTCVATFVPATALGGPETLFVAMAVMHIVHESGSRPLPAVNPLAWLALD
jgi:hypothetical protein